jgi:hypothetical protein
MASFIQAANVAFYENIFEKNWIYVLLSFKEKRDLSHNFLTYSLFNIHTLSLMYLNLYGK